MKARKIVTAAMCLCMIAQTAGYMPVFQTTAANGNIVVEQPVKTEIYDIFQYRNLGNYIEIVATATNATGVVEVPAEIDGLPVKTAAEHAFAGNQNVTSIKLPDTLTTIGKGAFQGDTALTSVNIPEGVTQIKDETFLNCMSLRRISLPESLKSIGVRAFYNCDLGEVDIPDSVNKIGSQAFDSCRNLISANIPDGVTVIEEGVFSNCDLDEIDIPESVEKICKLALPSGIKKVYIHNPNCEIELFAISGKQSEVSIIAPANSKVQEQAETYGFVFYPMQTVVSGDANGDGEFGISDAVILQKYLMGDGEITDWKSVDFTGDGVIDVFDLCLMKQSLLYFLNPPIPGFGESPNDIVNLTADIKSAEVEGKDADEAFVNGQTEFALEIFKKSVEENRNVLVSPYSIVQALAMTGNGADGITKEEFEKVIGGGIDFDELNKYLYTLRTGQPNDEKCKLLTANSVWTRDNEARISPYPEFLQKVVDYYSAEVFKAPFDDETVKEVNKWVDTNTDHMIPKIVDKIDPETVMMLINAVTFDAKWRSPYFKEDVWEHDFTNYNGTVQQAEMMFSNEYSYLEDENATGFYKYYEGGRYAFAALLPNEDISVVDYVNSLTPESLHNILSNPQDDYTRTGLPKFSYDYNNDLVNILAEMGMPSAFGLSGDACDFSRLAPQGIFISKVIHKTHIDVFEEGTRAAAVTGVFATDTCVPILPEKEVILDRPFVYCIVDTENYLPVFMGTLMSVE